VGEEGVRSWHHMGCRRILTFMMRMAKKGWLCRRGEPPCFFFELTGFEPGVMLLIGIRKVARQGEAGPDASANLTGCLRKGGR